MKRPDLQYRVRHKRTGAFTRHRPWPRVGDVRQHLNKKLPRELLDLEVVEYRVTETRRQDARDFLAKRPNVPSPPPEP